MKSAGSARRDVGIAPYKERPDSPGCADIERPERGDADCHTVVRDGSQ